MSTSNTSRSILSLVFTWLMIISLAGFALLAVVLAELAESSWVVPNFMQTYLSYRDAWQNSTGNEFTGEATAWLFGVSAVPVGIDLISRTVIRYVPLGETAKGFIRRINNIQRKYLMRFHTWLSILALGLGILHLTLSSCAANPFPEWGLILTGILVTTGLLFKWKAVSSKFRKTLYKFHSSLIVTGALLIVLVIGHSVMGSD
jgi:hypothetical protein